MTSSFGPPPAPPGPPVPPGPPAPPPPGGGRGSKSRVGLTIGIGVLALVLIGGAAFGAYRLYENVLGGGGPQPHDVLPADTIAYARVDLDPSASQKISLLRLINRSPEVAKAIDVDPDDDLREVVFSRMLQIDKQCGIDYEDDVEPWLGERAGVALVGGFDITDNSEETGLEVANHTLIVVQVSDEDEAREGIQNLASECGINDALEDDLGVDEPPGIAFRDGYALIGVDQESVDALAESTDEKSLADNDRFTADFDELGDDGLASVWMDHAAYADLARSAIEELDGDDLAGVEDFLKQYERFDSSAGALRATNTSIEGAGIVRLVDDFEAPENEGLAALPTDTLFGLSFTGGGPLFEEAWRSLEPLLADLYESELGYDAECLEEPVPPQPEVDPETGEPVVPEGVPETAEPDEGGYGPPCGTDPSFDEFLAELEAEFGIGIPDDVVTLLGNAVTLYVGETNLEDFPSFRGPEDIENLSAGFVFESPGDVSRLTDLIADAMSENGIDLASLETDDGAVLATNDDIAQLLADGSDLGEEAPFKAVIDHEGTPLGGMYLDIEAVIRVLRAYDPPPEVEDVLDELAFLQSFGIAAWQQSDDAIRFTATLSFTESDD